VTPAQQGVWVVQCALYRGSRHARKQRVREVLSGAAGDVMSLDEYIARREARGTE